MQTMLHTQFRFCFLVILTLLVSMPAVASANTDHDAEWLIESSLSKGKIGIQYPLKKNTLTKVIIKKDKSTYAYTLGKSAPDTEWFPLQLGNGAYDITIAEQASGNKFKVAANKKIQVKIDQAAEVFLNSIQTIEWTSADKAIVKAKQLTRNSKSDESKVAAIYQYIVNNVRYDKKLAEEAKPGYIPDIERTFASNKGICYDYAALFAAMLRSEGIPAKLVMGTSNAVDEYHAWNEAYVNDKWVVIDTTVDATYVQAGRKIPMAKKAEDYAAEKIY